MEIEIILLLINIILLVLIGILIYQVRISIVLHRKTIASLYRMIDYINEQNRTGALHERLSGELDITMKKAGAILINDVAGLTREFLDASSGKKKGRTN